MKLVQGSEEEPPIVPQEQKEGTNDIEQQESNKPDLQNSDDEKSIMDTISSFGSPTCYDYLMTTQVSRL